MTECTFAEKLEIWPVERLIPYANNPRTHSPEQIAQIARSIQEFGFTNPVLIDGKGGVIAGHGRLMAARELGLSTVPVVKLAHLTEAQKRAYIIADNKLALNAGWDEELLAQELQALDINGFDLELTGFAGNEIEALLAELEGRAEGLTSKDEAPEVPDRPVTRSGDLWQLGPHRLLCGDATKPEAVSQVLEGGLADMVFTDPPYNVDYRGSAHDRRQGIARTMLNDDLGSGFSHFLEAACRNILAVTKGVVYICMSSSEIHTLQRAFLAAGGHWSSFIIWAKNAFTLGRSDYQRQYEPILYGWKEGSEHYWCGARDQGDVWFVNRQVANDLHPTMKPVELIERTLHNSSKTRDTVLDPFAGSGSTLIACEATDRQARLIELDPRYCDVIVRRWEEFTGNKCVLAADGMTFDQARASRHD